VTIIAHFCEIKKPSNTSKLCARVLQNCRILAVGARELPHAAQSAPSNGVAAALAALEPRQTLLLYPSDDAVPLDAACVSKLETPENLELVVPDGTWAETRRLVRRSAALQALPKVRLDAQQTLYALRRNLEPGLLCTLEAVAHALALLDGPKLRQDLLAAFAEWQQHALAHRQGRSVAESLP
jgi:DTW domain-containing protein YfiP